MQLPKMVTVITYARKALSVHGLWLSRRVQHMPPKGHVLNPDLVCPVFEDVFLV